MQRAQGVADALVIDADGRHLDRNVVKLESVDDVLPQGLAGFGAETPDLAGCIVAGQRGQIDHGDGAQEPGRLANLS